MTDFVAMQTKIQNHFEQCCVDARKQALVNKKRNMKNLGEMFNQCQLLVLAGLITESQMESCIKWGRYNSEIECQPGDKIKLRDLFGDFTVNEKPDDVINADLRTVKFYLNFANVNYVGPKWFVVSVLPEDSKCKIVKETSSSTYTSLACDV